MKRKRHFPKFFSPNPYWNDTSVVLADWELGNRSGRLYKDGTCSCGVGCRHWSDYVNHLQTLAEAYIEGLEKIAELQAEIEELPQYKELAEFLRMKEEAEEVDA